MKLFLTCLMILACLFLSLPQFAQTMEGVIEYEVKVNLHRTLPPDRAEMKNMIPEFRTSKHQLLFNERESLFKAIVEDEEPMDVNSGGVQIRLQQPHIEIYFDAASQRRVIEQEFMGKDYLIEDSVSVTPWKFGADSRKIIGFDCQPASYYDEQRKQKITAWYTTKLRPFLGPESANSLPGTVLLIDINDGERVVSARSLTMRSLKKSELKIPDRGIKTSQREFQKMRDEQVQRMRANGANVIIRN